MIKKIIISTFLCSASMMLSTYAYDRESDPTSACIFKTSETILNEKDSEKLKKILTEVATLGYKNAHHVAKKFAIKNIELRTLVKRYNRNRYIFTIEQYDRIPLTRKSYTDIEIYEFLTEVLENNKSWFSTQIKYDLIDRTLLSWAKRFTSNNFVYKNYPLFCPLEDSIRNLSQEIIKQLSFQDGNKMNKNLVSILPKIDSQDQNDMSPKAIAVEEADTTLIRKRPLEEEQALFSSKRVQCNIFPKTVLEKVVENVKSKKLIAFQHNISEARLNDWIDYYNLGMFTFDVGVQEIFEESFEKIRLQQILRNYAEGILEIDGIEKLWKVSQDLVLKWIENYNAKQYLFSVGAEQLSKDGSEHVRIEFALRGLGINPSRCEIARFLKITEELLACWEKNYKEGKYPFIISG